MTTSPAQRARMVVGIILLLTNTLVAAQELQVGAQVRPRAEFRNGFKTLTSENRDPALFIEQRTRLFADFQTKQFRVHINMQDVRIWGAADQIYKSDPALFNIYEGWGEYFFSPKLSLRVGRMALDYDNARFLGDLDWAAQGRSHDAILFRYEDDSAGWEVHAAAAFNQTANPPEQARLFGTFYAGVSNYKAMQSLYVRKQLESSTLSFLFQNDGRQFANTQDTTVAYRQTYAVTFNHNRPQWGIGGEFYYQGGKNGANIDVSAFLAALSFTWKTDVTPVTVGIDYLSGTSLEDDKDLSFNPLYGTNHKFYGFMDYFYVGNFHGQASSSSGLNDIYLKTNWKIAGRARLNAHLHAFSSSATLFDREAPQTEIGRYLGTEIDLVFVWKPVEFVSATVGYSHMLATSSMEAIKTSGGDHAALNNWAWLMINFNPILFEKKFP